MYVKKIHAHGRLAWCGHKSRLKKANMESIYTREEYFMH